MAILSMVAHWSGSYLFVAVSCCGKPALIGLVSVLLLCFDFALL